MRRRTAWRRRPVQRIGGALGALARGKETALLELHRERLGRYERRSTARWRCEPPLRAHTARCRRLFVRVPARRMRRRWGVSERRECPRGMEQVGALLPKNIGVRTENRLDPVVVRGLVGLRHIRNGASAHVRSRYAAQRKSIWLGQRRALVVN